MFPRIVMNTFRRRLQPQEPNLANLYTKGFHGKPIKLVPRFTWVDSMEGYRVAIIDIDNYVRGIYTPPPESERIKINIYNETDRPKMEQQDSDDHPVDFVYGSRTFPNNHPILGNPRHN